MPVRFYVCQFYLLLLLCNHDNILLKIHRKPFDLHLQEISAFSNNVYLKKKGFLTF